MWPLNDDRFWFALEDMHMLTSLGKITLMNGMISNLCSMSQLRSLDFWNRLENDKPLPQLFLNLPQLTQLCIRNCKHGSSLTHLSGLVDLWFDTNVSARAIDFCSTLTGMPHLERLKISNFSKAYLHGNCINQLQQLKSLTVEGVKLDEVFFVALSSLTGLTKLGIIGCAISEPSHLSTICTLPLLEKLTLKRCRVENPLDVISDGKLLRLKYLQIGVSTMSRQTIRELNRRLPSLRQFNRRSPGFCILTSYPFESMD